MGRLGGENQQDPNPNRIDDPIEMLSLNVLINRASPVVMFAPAEDLRGNQAIPKEGRDFRHCDRNSARNLSGMAGQITEMSFGCVMVSM
jgi:hypothetical protein